MTARQATFGALVALTAAAPAAAQTIAITGGKVYPVSGPPIENGTVIMSGGKITAVGANVPIPAGAQRVDATGKWVTPGLINAATRIGIVEVGFSGGPRDVSAKGQDEIAASFQPWTALNSRSVMIAPTREDGITTVLQVPEGGLIAGQAALIDLVNGTAKEMVLAAPAVMVGQADDADNAGTGSRGELVGKLRELLGDTKAYAAHRAAYERGETREYSARRADLEAMIPVVEGRLPLLVEVDRVDDIAAALDIAKDFGVKLIIGGGAEAWMIADRLAKQRVPVMTGAMNNDPDSFNTLGQRQENAALLHKAGVPLVIIGNGGGDEEAFNARNIRYEAGNAVAYGLSWEDALRAITLGPAEVLGVADRVGSLRPGREANVVIWSGDPFEFATAPEQVYIRGQKITPESRQDLLIERYKTLPPSYAKP